MTMREVWYRLVIVAILCVIIPAAVVLLKKQSARGQIPSADPHQQEKIVSNTKIPRKKIFVTAIGCIDGRTDKPTTKYMEDHEGADWVDKPNTGGVVKILAENWNRQEVERIIKDVRISVQEHHSRVIAIVAHDKCAGNKEHKQKQLQQLRAARQTVRSYGFNTRIILLWIEYPWKEMQLIE